MNRKVLNREEFIKSLKTKQNIAMYIIIILLGVALLGYTCFLKFDIQLFLGGVVAIVIAIYMIKMLLSTDDAAVTGKIMIRKLTLERVKVIVSGRSRRYELVFTDDSTCPYPDATCKKFKPGEKFFVILAHHGGGAAMHAFSCNKYRLGRDFQEIYASQLPPQSEEE